jgi:hypothetical protein
MPYSSKASSGIMKKYFVSDTSLFENQLHHCEVNTLIIIIIIIWRRGGGEGGRIKEDKEEEEETKEE